MDEEWKIDRLKEAPLDLAIEIARLEQRRALIHDQRLASLQAYGEVPRTSQRWIDNPLVPLIVGMITGAGLMTLGGLLYILAR